jgi:leucyl aminopeptidase (aminopeptidase T)
MSEATRPSPESASGNGYDLVPGARNAVRTCLSIAARERVAIVTDRETRPIAASLAAELREVRAHYELHVLEDYGERPMLALPKEIREAFERSDVSIYAGQPLPGELAFRRQMTAIVNRRRMRHAHMVSVTPRIMAEGMRADFELVDRISTRVRDRAANADRVRARSRAGTDIEATFDPAVRWLKTSGLITPEKWGNLPGGEVLTAPARVDGVYVVDGVLGDFLCARYGDLEATPLTVWIEDSRIRDARCERRDVLEDFLAYTRADENSDRVGELAMGTNVAVHSIIGNILQDEKLPGLHLAFGHTYAEHTGASWSCSTHLDIVGRHFDVWFDEEQVMSGGKFLI